MKTTAVKHLTGAACAVACLVALPAFADQPGKGWDTFRTGGGEPIAAHQSSAKAVDGAPGKGWDTFRTGAGEPIKVHAPVAVAGNGAPGKGWDTFRIGAGEALPRSGAVHVSQSQ